MALYNTMQATTCHNNFCAFSHIKLEIHVHMTSHSSVLHRNDQAVEHQKQCVDPGDLFNPYILATFTIVAVCFWIDLR